MEEKTDIEPVNTILGKVTHSYCHTYFFNVGLVSQTVCQPQSSIGSMCDVC